MVKLLLLWRSLLAPPPATPPTKAPLVDTRPSAQVYDLQAYRARVTAEAKGTPHKLQNSRPAR